MASSSSWNESNNNKQMWAPPGSCETGRNESNQSKGVFRQSGQKKKKTTSQGLAFALRRSSRCSSPHGGWSSYACKRLEALAQVEPHDICGKRLAQ
jgi:hypothetical protein